MLLYIVGFAKVNKVVHIEANVDGGGPRGEFNSVYAWNVGRGGYQPHLSDCAGEFSNW